MWTLLGRRGVAGLIVSCIALVGAGANAQERDFEGLPREPAERRSGFTFGLAGGLALLQLNGYPNDVAKIDVPEFGVNTGTGVTTGGALWIGGVLTDWLSLGIGTLGANTESNGLTVSGGALLVRVETFPLFFRGGHFRDLGLVLSAGTGGYTVERGDEAVAEGEGTSVVGAGIFYEPWQWWRLSSGPQLEYCHHFSRSISAHTLVLGFRTAFYGGP